MHKIKAVNITIIHVKHLIIKTVITWCSSCYYVDRVWYLTCSTPGKLSDLNRFLLFPGIFQNARHMLKLSTYAYSPLVPSHTRFNPTIPWIFTPTGGNIVHYGHDGRTPRVPSSPGRMVGACLSESDGTSKASPAPLNRLHISVKLCQSAGEQWTKSYRLRQSHPFHSTSIS